MDRVPKTQLRVIQQEEELLGPIEGIRRPRTRGECVNGIRPCPFVSCSMNLYIDVAREGHSIKFNFPDIEPDQMPPNGSCALDVADQGGATLERVGDLLNVTRERVRQAEETIFEKLKLRLGPALRDLMPSHSIGYAGGDDDEDEDGEEASISIEEIIDDVVPPAPSSETAQLSERAYRTYDRDVRWRDSKGSGIDKKRTARASEEVLTFRLSAEEQAEIDAWSSTVLLHLRQGAPLSDALAASTTPGDASLQQRILLLLAEGSKSRPQIALLAGGGADTVDDALSRLQKRGLISQRRGTDRWSLVRIYGKRRGKRT